MTKFTNLRSVVLILGAIALFGLAVGVTEVQADDTRAFEYLVGEDSDTDPRAIICGGEPPCPDSAVASMGEVIVIAGQGTFIVHQETIDIGDRKTVDIDGGGTFSADALEPEGDPVEGTWKATELLSFESYGPSPSPGFPPDFLAGLAMIRIELFVPSIAPFDGETWVADAILTLGCILPEVVVPAGSIEGVRVNVQGGLNFDIADTRSTLFIELDPDDDDDDD